jgi:hypothetical protein
MTYDTKLLMKAFGTAALFIAVPTFAVTINGGPFLLGLLIGGILNMAASLFGNRKGMHEQDKKFYSLLFGIGAVAAVPGTLSGFGII